MKTLHSYWIQFVKLAKKNIHPRTITAPAVPGSSESDDRRRIAFENSGDGVWDWTLKTNDVFFSDQ